MKITAILLELGQTRVFYQPNQPENHRKEKEEGKGETVREKKTTTVFSFYSVHVDLREDAYFKGLFLPYIYYNIKIQCAL